MTNDKGITGSGEAFVIISFPPPFSCCSKENPVSRIINTTCYRIPLGRTRALCIQTLTLKHVGKWHNLCRYGNGWFGFVKSLPYKCEMKSLSAGYSQDLDVQSATVNSAARFNRSPGLPLKACPLILHTKEKVLSPLCRILYSSFFSNTISCFCKLFLASDSW